MTMASARPVYTALSEVVNRFFQDRGEHRTGDTALHRKVWIILALHSSSYLLLLLLPQPLNVLVWLFHGLTTCLVGFNIMHDGGHGSLTSSQKLNLWAARSFNLIGSHAYYWWQKHNLSHHSYTNISGIDEDIESFGMLRMSPHQPQRWFHRFQHLYVWLMYPTVSLIWFFFLDYKAYFSEKIAERNYSRPYSRSESLLFWLSKASYIVLYLIIPILVLGWQTALVGFLLMHAIMSTVFTVVFQLAHVVDKAEFPELNEMGRLQDEWAVHQLKTTVDFAPDSRFLTWCLGGLNYQTEHHLFPRISHAHYPELYGLVRERCGQLGIEHRVYPTFWQALVGHYRHLRTMGQPVN
ncbi:fatty acid desaturase family protein [Parendozoicomonas haliclonae]|uniref:Stearoyl-CoA 9-desaturase n=1 Tax=Parendozoicomonas haliclonae TaxID=1960125 RepID=A0A1X7AG60_9GAMM|nr:acyl-CoA desaturase [Parendozoicomonas haliclonae]SMA37950.1 Stearoyl-CoA 9-desaturase [Parendozoicomonas haliclonae]